VLEQELARFPKWLVWSLLVSPRLELVEASAARLGADAWRVRLVVQNTGWLPSYVTKRALAGKRVRGVVAEIELPSAARLETGSMREELPQLEGRAYKPAVPSSWAGWSGDATEDRAKVEWVVRAPSGGTVKLVAKHERAGTVRAEIALE